MTLPFVLKPRPALAARAQAHLPPGFRGVVTATRNGLTVLEIAAGGVGRDTAFPLGGLAAVFGQVAALQLVQAGVVEAALPALDAAAPVELAALVEAAAGEPYGVYLRRRVLRPARMTRSGLDAATAPDLAAFVQALVARRLLADPHARQLLDARPAWSAEGAGFSAAVRILAHGEAAVVVLAQTPGASAVADAVAAEMEGV